MSTFKIRQGDHGRALEGHLAAGDGGYYNVPAGSTVTFAATEQPEAPRRERRAARVLGGAATVDGTDASLVSYVFTVTDSAHVGLFDGVWVVDLPGGERETFPTSSSPPDGLVIEVCAPPGA